MINVRVLQLLPFHLIVGSYIEALAQQHNEVGSDVNCSERHHVDAAAVCDGSERARDDEDNGQLE